MRTCRPAPCLSRPEAQPLTLPQHTMMAEDKVEVDPAVLSGLELWEWAAKEAAVQGGLWRDEFWKDCLAAQQYGLKVGVQPARAREACVGKGVGVASEGRTGR